MNIEIPNEWNPRDYQMPLWMALQCGKKRAVAVWHRRAGKDSLSLNFTASKALFDRVGVYWHMAPTQKQVRKIVWDNIGADGKRIIDQVWPGPCRKSIRNDEMKIELVNGSIWQCVGSDNYDSLVGANPVGVVFSEYSLANPAAWDYIRPILAENGGWALFIYTPRGSNHGEDLYNMAVAEDDWFAEILTIEETLAIPKSAVEDERRAGMSEENIQQEFYCSFAGVVDGSYYGKMLEDAKNDDRITSVPVESELEVHTAWDLGIGDSTVLWAYQLIGKSIHIINYYEASGEGLGHYAGVLNKWRDDLGYRFGTHYLPHDVEVKELGTGKSRLETLRELGITVKVVPKLSVEDGINAVRRILSRCWFDAKNCKEGMRSLRQYRREFDEKRKTFRNNPLHDWASHGADGFRYLAVGLPDKAKHKPLKYDNSGIV